MRTFHVVNCVALLAIGARALPAQQPRAWAPTFGFGVGSMSIESGTATRSQVGDQSWGMQLDAGVLVKRHLYLGMDLGGQFLDDKAQFQQNTTGGMMKSTAQLTYFSAITGVRTGTLRVVPLSLGVNVGASATVTRRSIDNCTDCQVDKLDIPGGAWVEPTLLFGPRSLRLRVSNRVYLAGDGMRNVLSVGGDFTSLKR